MTNDKAREFFSAFHEGTLEPGLRASLERRLGADAELRSEYAAFVETVESLDGLRDEAIEIPAYLSARIADRLDPVLDAKRVPFWQALFAPRPAAPRYGWALGVAGLALVSSLIYQGVNVSGVSSADVTGASSRAVDGVHWSKETGELVVSLVGAAPRVVSVAPEGGSAQSFSLAQNQPLEVTLSNPNNVSRRFAVAVGDAPFATVAMPGKVKSATARRTGSGTLAELASALSDHYGIVVVVKGLPVTTPVRWSFEGIDARAAAETSLAKPGSATMMDDRLLQIGG